MMADSSSTATAASELIRSATPRTQSRDIQDYLFSFMPILAEGLTELSLHRPSDPYAFLASLLLKKSKYPNAGAITKTIDEYIGPLTIKKSNTTVAAASSSTVHPSTSTPSATATTTTTPEKKPLHIIIAGAPCSGKGTQCELIKKKYNIVHISTGDLLREAVAAGTPLGIEAKSFMDGGKLVPDQLIIGLVKEKLSESTTITNGWLLDGFPRTFLQSEALKEAGINADLFIVLEVPDTILIERVTGRRLDPITGKIYHLKYDPPIEGDIASRCIQRSDDTEEKISVRLQAYHNAIGAIKGSYNNIMHSINGDRAKGEIFNDIDTLLSKLS